MLSLIIRVVCLCGVSASFWPFQQKEDAGYQRHTADDDAAEAFEMKFHKPEYPHQREKPTANARPFPGDDRYSRDNNGQGKMRYDICRVEFRAEAFNPDYAMEMRTETKKTGIFTNKKVKGIPLRMRKLFYEGKIPGFFVEFHSPLHIPGSRMNKAKKATITTDKTLGNTYMVFFIVLRSNFRV